VVRALPERGVFGHRLTRRKVKSSQCCTFFLHTENSPVCGEDWQYQRYV